MATLSLITGLFFPCVYASAQNKSQTRAVSGTRIFSTTLLIFVEVRSIYLLCIDFFAFEFPFDLAL